MEYAIKLTKQQISVLLNTVHTAAQSTDSPELRAVLNQIKKAIICRKLLDE